MATVAAIAGVVAAGAAVVQTIGNAKAQKRQRVLGRVRNRRSTIQQFRESRIRAGQIRQAGINSGAGLDSSSVVSGFEGVVQQARGNVNFINTVAQLQNSIASARSMAALAKGVFSFSSSLSRTANSGVFG